MRSCHTMVKSAVLPKTTSLCTSITVITLWYGGSPPLVPHPTPPCQTPCSPATCRCCHAHCCSRRRVCAAVQSSGHFLLGRRLCVLFFLSSCAGGALNTLSMLQALSHFIHARMSSFLFENVISCNCANVRQNLSVTKVQCSVCNRRKNNKIHSRWLRVLNLQCSRPLSSG